MGRCLTTNTRHQVPVPGTGCQSRHQINQQEAITMAQSATNGFTGHETATRMKLGSDGVWRCHYHGTQIASLNNNTILHLNTGGCNTQTTRRRMNQFASELNLPFQVSQRDG